jgi:hypothetical protein
MKSLILTLLVFAAMQVRADKWLDCRTVWPDSYLPESTVKKQVQNIDSNYYRERLPPLAEVEFYFNAAKTVAIRQGLNGFEEMLIDVSEPALQGTVHLDTAWFQQVCADEHPELILYYHKVYKGSHGKRFWSGTTKHLLVLDRDLSKAYFKAETAMQFSNSEERKEKVKKIQPDGSYALMEHTETIHNTGKVEYMVRFEENRIVLVCSSWELRGKNKDPQFFPNRGICAYEWNGQQWNKKKVL